jgi:hypothetical protein
MNRSPLALQRERRHLSRNVKAGVLVETVVDTRVQA